MGRSYSPENAICQSGIRCRRHDPFIVVLGTGEADRHQCNCAVRVSNSVGGERGNRRHRMLEPRAGLEPATLRLRNGRPECSFQPEFQLRICGECRREPNADYQWSSHRDGNSTGGLTSAGSARRVHTARTVSFGNVTDCSSNCQTVRLAKSGSGSLTISSASVSGSGFGISGLSTPLTLTPEKTTACL